MFTKIIITPETLTLTPSQWGERISEILDNDICDILHLRLPKKNEEFIREILMNVNPSKRNQITLHDYHNLAIEGLAGGIHLNQRNPELPSDITKIRISRSCHNFNEVEACDPAIYSYVTLSPIFDSISKKGYTSPFTLKELHLFLANITLPVVALGGILRSHFSMLRSFGFSGAATLSDTAQLF